MTASAAGAFIALEGGEGAGKSTQGGLLATHLRASGREVVWTREPGGTPASEAIRAIVLSPEFEGLEPRAEALAALYEHEYKDVLARIAKAGGAKKKVYIELGQAGPETVGNSYSGTMWGKLLNILGADNMADGKLTGPWGPLNAEAVLAENPHLIFMAGSSWVNRPKAVKTGYEATPEQTRQSLAPYAQRAGWANLKAVRNGELHAIEHGLCRTLFDFVAMQYIAKRLYPEAFRDVDPDASFRAYHEKYLPVAYSGTWMLPLKP